MPVTLICCVLLAVAVVTSVWNPHRIPLLTVGSAGMAAVMLGVIFVPGLSHVAGAAMLIGLALFVAAGVLPTWPWRSRHFDRRANHTHTATIATSAIPARSA